MSSLYPIEQRRGEVKKPSSALKKKNFLRAASGRDLGKETKSHEESSFIQEQLRVYKQYVKELRDRISDLETKSPNNKANPNNIFANKIRPQSNTRSSRIILSHSTEESKSSKNEYEIMKENEQYDENQSRENDASDNYRETVEACLKQFDSHYTIIWEILKRMNIPQQDRFSLERELKYLQSAFEPIQSKKEITKMEHHPRDPIANIREDELGKLKRRPTPPSRSNRPALKDVSVLQNQLPEVSVSINRFRSGKSYLRPFDVSPGERRRFTYFGSYKSRTVSLLPEFKRKRANTEPSLCSWEMPRAAFKEKNYAPSFDTEITHNQMKFQTLLARQDKITESLHIENSISVANNANHSSLSQKTRSDSASLTFTLTEGRSILVGGFISHLITWVLDRSSDWNEYDSILYHFRYFLSPNDFLRAIIQWYEDSSDSLSPQAKLLRVESVLGRWLHLCPSDFLSLESLTTDFINFLNFVKMIDSSIYSNIHLIYLDMTKPKISKSKQPILIVHNQLDVLSFAPMDIAKQLSLDHFDLFYEITWSDLIDSKARQQSGRIDVLVKHFNNISLLVATEIVTTPNIKKRMAVIKHMISLAQACFELRNFSMLLAITVGLNMGPIQRLKKVWKMVPRASMNTLNTLEDLMSPFGNYSKYRTALQNSSYPCLPYFGLYLRDLTYIEDGNADLLENGHCNMEKMRMKTAILKDVRYHQRRRYDFPPASKIESYLYSMKVLDPPAIQKISSTIEENVL